MLKVKRTIGLEAIKALLVSKVGRVALALSLAIFAFSALLPKTSASNPQGGTLNPTDAAALTWTGTGTAGGALNDLGLGVLGDNEALCTEGENCDTYMLTVSGSPSDWAGKYARVEITWGLPASDYDLYVRKGSLSGPVVANSGRGATSPSEPQTQEDVNLDVEALGTGTYAVRVVYYAATSADQYQGRAFVTEKPAPPPEEEQPTSTEAAPSYQVHMSPAGVGDNAGEPTIGANWATGNAMFIAMTETLRVTFDDSVSPSKATWTNVSAPNTSVDTWDPILFTDGDSSASHTNRTFVSQLLFPTKQSLMAYTDDDGQSWTPSQGAGINSGVDHQTVGGGPYAKNADGSLKGGAIQRPGPNGATYPNAIYYASQDIGLAQIARSDDGGFTFGAAVPMYNLVQCNGLHGHIKVAPDGTVYVPNPNCAGAQGLAVSEDNGLTWEVRLIPGSTSSVSDPSVGIGADGTIYYGYADDNDATPKVAVSRDKGRTWTYVRNVGRSQGIKNVAFPAVVAGDGDRAAVFFLGSTTAGQAGVGQDLGGFDGTWYGYIAMTYDGGNTWVTVNATPHDPVQRGPICGQGTLCASGTRKLLDFNDATVDKQGRVLAAFADGCVTAACITGTDKDGNGVLNGHDNDKEDKGAIIRQSGGKGLFAAYDAVQSVTLAKSAVPGGQGTSAVLKLREPAPAGGAKVQLFSSDPTAATVPTSVTVAAGLTEKSFSITTKPVSSDKSVQITSYFKGQNKVAALQVKSPALVGLMLSPSTVTGPCGTSAGKVTISGKAPAGGLSVALSTTTAGASVPSSVTVPAGQTSATFTVAAADVAARQTGTVTAALGSASFSKPLTVMPNGIKALTLNPASVTGPAPSTGTVSLACAAPAGGVTVTLSSSAPSVARPTVSSVVIPQGQTSANFSIKTADVVSAGTATIKATALGASKSVKLAVN